MQLECWSALAQGKHVREEWPQVPDDGFHFFSDGQWGGQEYTRWPQVFSNDALHHTTIPSGLSEGGEPLRQDDHPCPLYVRRWGAEDFEPEKDPEGKPIPGIKDIPDTILEGQASENQAEKRKKPWEKESGAVESPSWMT